MQEQAARIPDEAMRRSFLENVAENRELAAEFERANGPSDPGFRAALQRSMEENARLIADLSHLGEAPETHD